MFVSHSLVFDQKRYLSLQTTSGPKLPEATDTELPEVALKEVSALQTVGTQKYPRVFPPPHLAELG